jgi:uncharacterized protein YqgC (DUF456 family)
MLILIICIGIILILAGLIGCIVPVIPGPPLSFIAILLLGLRTSFKEPLSVTLIVVLGVIALIVSIADNIIPILGARQFGASVWGIWGSFIGLILGLIFFPPFGLILGAIVGAIAGEYIDGKKHGAAFKAGFGVIVGSLCAVVMKLIVSGLITYYFIKALFML